GRDERGVAVPEVERRVAREQVQVAHAVGVRDPRALALDERHGERLVVRGEEGLHRAARISSVQHLAPPPPLSSSEVSTGMGVTPRARTASARSTAPGASTTFSPSLTALRPSAAASRSLARIACGKRRSSSVSEAGEKAGG